MTEVTAIFQPVFSLIKTDNNRKCLRHCLFSLLLFTQATIAIETVSIAVENINTKDWQLSGLSLSLSDIHQETQQLVLLIDQLLLTESLPDPSNQAPIIPELSFIDIKCHHFSWQDQRVNCQAGTAKLKSARFQSHSFGFSFLITETYSQVSIQKLKLAKGYLSLTAKEQGGQWSISLNSKEIDLQTLYSFLPAEQQAIFEINKGKMKAEAQLSGTEKGINKVNINSVFTNLMLQADEGNIATESLTLAFKLQAKKNRGDWTWFNKNQLTQGELYVDPVYLTLKNQTLILDTEGVMNKQDEFYFRSVQFKHPEVIELNAAGKISQSPDLILNDAHIELKTNKLQPFFSQYIVPFIEQTAMDGISLKGLLKAEIKIDQNKIKQVKLNIEHLLVDDQKNRFSISDAQTVINWSVDSAFSTPSKFSWQQLQIKAIPINAGHVDFLAKDSSISLLHPSSISLLGGFFDIKRFDWAYQKNDDPKVYFEGGIRHLSLEQLSTALQWPPLAGDISGDIPGVVYENKTLKVDGGLQVNLFGGTIKINKLASSGMFKDFSRFYMDMEIDNLDLNEITQKFKVGSMEGRVSGFINNLYLENWQPVNFYAWIGTPENDQSRHRISQKAVQNIASIGGGGAADIISKGFLRFFDSFGYDKLGFGCYLNQGVCQLMGVEAAEQGYYIIKGSGIPRINVIGYNPRMDWNVLMQRLSRIVMTDDVVIE